MGESKQWSWPKDTWIILEVSILPYERPSANMTKDEMGWEKTRKVKALDKVNASRQAATRTFSQQTSLTEFISGLAYLQARHSAQFTCGRASAKRLLLNYLAADCPVRPLLAGYEQLVWVSTSTLNLDLELTGHTVDCRHIRREPVDISPRMMDVDKRRQGGFREWKCQH